MAAANGIDYWAYLYFGASDTSNMNAGLAYHKASSIASKVKICLMPAANLLGTTASHSAQIADLITTIVNPNYMLVGGRPLIYIYMNSTDIATNWGGVNANFAAFISDLRAAVIAAGLKNPFVTTVGSGGDRTSLATFGVDAVSNYTGLIPTGNGSTYASMDLATRQWWDTALTASAIVPICMVGWDPRPRNQDPESFATAEANWVVTPTLSEFTTHLKAARTYTGQFPWRCPAKTVLVYAMTEYDEGGVMPGPTVGDPAGTLGQAFAAAKV